MICVPAKIVSLAFACLLAGFLGRAGAMDLTEWKVDGDVRVDSGRSHGGHGAALKIAPGGKATKILRAESGSGRVTLWVYDDMTVPADPKARGDGPCWGIVQPDGQALIVTAWGTASGGDRGRAAGWARACAISFGPGLYPVVARPSEGSGRG